MPTDIPATQVSSYLAHLPAIFQQDAEANGVTLIGRFLLAFEKMLTGLGDPDQSGLEEVIDRLYTYLDPGAIGAGQPVPPAFRRTPPEFLPWLASWVALSLREDWAEEEKRRFISQIVPLYRKRGTVAGLTEILRIYVGMGVEISELHTPFQVGVTSTLGVDAAIGGGPPHYFLVKIVLQPGAGGVDLERREAIARAIIEQEKPAHTYYDLIQEVPTTIKIGEQDHSTVGVNTLLGTPKE